MTGRSHWLLIGVLASLCSGATASADVFTAVFHDVTNYTEIEATPAVNPPRYVRQIPCPEIRSRETRGLALQAQLQATTANLQKATTADDHAAMTKLAAELRGIRMRVATNTLVNEVLSHQRIREVYALYPQTGQAAFILGQSGPSPLPKTAELKKISGLSVTSKIALYTEKADGSKTAPSTVFGKVTAPSTPPVGNAEPPEFVVLDLHAPNPKDCEVSTGVSLKRACNVFDQTTAFVKTSVGQLCSADTSDLHGLLQFEVRYEAPELGPQAFDVTYRVGYAPEPTPGTNEALRLQTTDNLDIDMEVKAFIEDTLGTPQTYRVSDKTLAKFVKAGEDIKAVRTALNSMNTTLAKSGTPVTDPRLTAYFAKTQDRYRDGGAQTILFQLTTPSNVTKIQFSRVMQKVSIESIQVDGHHFYH